ncbi:MAG TPA: zinc-binding dehydrogenase [Anaerolineales bacterium]|jgi:NADPH:quinone reductase-like Zn-dependent oxidoreductase|nr:zinc-binding dehydrogenase [Anaerolineales bacterium]
MTQTQIPDQMTAVVLDSYSGAGALRVEQRPTPKPGEDEVLVKVAASPINPSDLAFLDGKYGFDNPPPVVPGGEGSGTVVAVGPGAMGRYFLGKRVACLSNGERDGIWAEYIVASTKGGTFPLNKSVSLEQGAMSVINPLTASAFLEITKEGGRKAIVLTAAASTLGQMVNRLGRSKGVQVINIVRRDAQVELLKAQGATVVLNSSDGDFDRQLHDACHQYDAHLAFDAVAGTMTGQLLNALPENSTITVYSCLSHKAPQTHVDQIVFQGKTITGFWLGPWLSSTKNLLQILMLWRTSQKLIGTDLKSEIRARYPFQEARKAVQEYSDHMTGGKVLLKPTV